jgi:selenocysteine-specific elongation factor
VVAVRGDRYVLRRPSPGETLGGGVVVDPQPKARHRRFDEAVLAGLAANAEGTPAEVLLQASLALGPATAAELIARSRLEAADAESALQELMAGGGLIAVGDQLLSAGQWSTLKESVAEALGAYHQGFPLRRGMPREELKSRLKLQPRLFNPLVTRLAADGVLVEGPKWVALPGHAVRFSPFQQVKVDKLMAQFAAAPRTPPSVKECQAEVGEDIFTSLVDQGDLVAVSTEVVFRKAEYESMVESIRGELGKQGEVSLAEVRDLLGTSRKYVQALLEHLDGIGVTVRNGDVRRLKI